MKKHTVLIIGSGGREHTLAWKLRTSPHVDQIFIAPGNAGTAEIGENVTLDITNHQEIIKFSQKEKIDLVVVAPDDPLAAGLVNDLQKAKIRAFGPTKEAAEIEASKVFAKRLMEKAGVPTATFATFNDCKKARVYLKTQAYPLVIKASGLALGKGAIIVKNFKAAQSVLFDMMVKKVFGKAGEQVVIEEYLEGAEISIHAFCDGKTAVLFPTSQDHKPIFENDQGPNTGGMGTIAPVPWVSKKLLVEIKQTIVEPILKALKESGREFKGVLYPGLMITKDGPKVLEFNARFGDPETQSYMRLLQTDLWEIINACIDGTLDKIKIRWKKVSVCCIVVASKGYPASSTKGIPIKGLPLSLSHLAGQSIQISSLDSRWSLPRASTQGGNDKLVVFHAATKKIDNELVTNGGRVLGITAIGSNLSSALRKAYSAIGRSGVHFAGMQYRKDIGKRKRPAFKI